MAVHFACPRCEKKLFLHEAKAEHLVRCACGYEFMVSEEALRAARLREIRTVIVLTIVTLVIAGGITLAYCLME